MKRYINIKNGNVVETLEEMNSDDYDNEQEFNTAVSVRRGSYAMIHKSNVYVSRRPDSSWTGN